MIDFHRVGNVGAILHIHANTESPLGKRGLDYMRAHLHVHQAGQPRRGTSFGDFGKASDLLQQLQHSYSCGHKLFLKPVAAGHVPSRMAQTRFGAQVESHWVSDRRFARVPQGRRALTDYLPAQMQLGRPCGFWLAHGAK